MSLLSKPNPVVLPTMTCPECGHEWILRKAEPKVPRCPKCREYLPKK